MADIFYIGAYWGPRTESVDDCAHRLCACLSRLGEAHPSLVNWLRKGKSKFAASREPVEVSQDALKELLASGRNRKDFGGEVIEELGFRATLWNGNSVAFSTRCGAHPATASVMNHFTLELPEPAGVCVELYHPEIAETVFGAIVESWDPNWATFASYAMRSAQTSASEQPIVGWLTYVSGTAEVRSPELSAKDFFKGTLVIAGADPRKVSTTQLSTLADFFPRKNV